MIYKLLVVKIGDITVILGIKDIQNVTMLVIMIRLHAPFRFCPVVSPIDMLSESLPACILPFVVFKLSILHPNKIIIEILFNRLFPNIRKAVVLYRMLLISDLRIQLLKKDNYVIKKFLVDILVYGVSELVEEIEYFLPI